MCVYVYIGMLAYVEVRGQVECLISFHLIFLKDLFYFSLYVCMWICAHECRCSQKPEEDIVPLKLDLRLLWAACHECWELNCSLLQEYLLLITQPSSSLWTLFFETGSLTETGLAHLAVLASQHDDICCLLLPDCYGYGHMPACLVLMWLLETWYVLQGKHFDD